jgi:hypothetical protein
MARTPEDKTDLGLTPEQMGQVLRFQLERHDQQKYGSERQIEDAAQIPGKDPFEIALTGKQLPQRGILVHAEVAKGYEGIISVYEYDGLEVKLDDQRPKGYDQIRMHADFASTTEHQLAYQNPNDFYRNTQPYERMSPTSYMGVGFDQLEGTDLSDGGRLLITRQPHNMTGGLFTSFDRSERELVPESRQREVLALFDAGDYAGAITAVRTVMSRLIGAASQDVDLATQQLQAKLTPPQV